MKSWFVAGFFMLCSLPGAAAWAGLAEQLTILSEKYSVWGSGSLLDPYDYTSGLPVSGTAVNNPGWYAASQAGFLSLSVESELVGAPQYWLKYSQAHARQILDFLPDSNNLALELRINNNMGWIYMTLSGPGVDYAAEPTSGLLKFMVEPGSIYQLDLSAHCDLIGETDDYGWACVEGNLTSAPAPGGLLLLAMGGLSLMRRRSRRRGA